MLSKAEYDVLEAVGRAPVEVGAAISIDGLINTLPGYAPNQIRTKLTSLAQKQLIEIDEQGGAHVTEAGVAALKSM